MATLPRLSALSLRVPVPVGVAGEDRVTLFSLCVTVVDETSVDKKVAGVEALIRLIRDDASLRRELMDENDVFPVLVHLLRDGHKAAMQLIAELRDTEDDDEIDTIDAQIGNANGGRDLVAPLAQFLFDSDDDDTAGMAGGMLAIMFDDDLFETDAVALAMLERGLVEQTVQALKDASAHRSAELMNLVRLVCERSDDLSKRVHSLMMASDGHGYKQLLEYLALEHGATTQEIDKVRHAFDALHKLLETSPPATPADAALFVGPLVADRAWTSSHTSSVLRTKIVEYLSAMADESEACAHEIAYHASFFARVASHARDDITAVGVNIGLTNAAEGLILKLEKWEKPTPWLELLLKLEQRFYCSTVQMLVPTEEALLEAIGANGSLYSAIWRYVQYTSAHKEEYGTCLLCSLFDTKRGEYAHTAARAERSPDPHAIDSVLDEYMEDLRRTNVPTEDDAELQRKVQAETATPLKDSLTWDQAAKLKRYNGYADFVDKIVRHKDFSMIVDVVTKDQTLGDDLKALVTELERPRHADGETWTLRHIVDMYNAGADMREGFAETLPHMESLLGRDLEQERRNPSKRPRQTAAALRAALAAARV
tara:strand:- start:1884 stop:3677 length:1794 start_codon:yes stop_codon:yes gene_type:complete